MWSPQRLIRVDQDGPGSGIAATYVLLTDTGPSNASTRHVPPPHHRPPPPRLARALPRRRRTGFNNYDLVAKPMSELENGSDLPS
jgi:hypothetical protein